MRYLASLLFLAWAYQAHAQLNSNAEIELRLKDYFSSTRENIHLHLNKSSYLSGEDIYFKGYVIDKQARLPFGPTVNVYVQLLSPDGQVLDNRLYYAENSILEGKLPLPDNLPSGVYYVQTYTNFMNNFTEDESSVYRISVANRQSGNLPDVSLPILSTVSLEFFAEGGIFLAGVENTFGISLLDCHGNGIEAKGIIVDAKGQTVAQFGTNIKGYGRFAIAENGAGPYFAEYALDGNNIRQPLPYPQQRGIALSVNNYATDKAIVKVTTNPQSVADYGRPLSVVVQQNGHSAFASVQLSPNQLARTLSIPREYFSGGINTIWLLDGNKAIAHRVIYSPDIPKAQLLVAVAERHRDSIVLRGKSVALADLSISVLPKGTISALPDKTMLSALEFDPFLKNPLADAGYYLNEFSRKRHYELDNALICSQSKYEWDAMMTPPTKNRFAFDQGFDIVGTVNTKPGEKNKIRMSSLAHGIDQSGVVNEKNDFAFRNVVVADSATIYFSLMKDDKILKTPLSARIENHNRRFLKKFLPVIRKCDQQQYATFDENLSLPELKGAIQIAEVETKEKTNREKLTDRRKTSALHGGVMTRGYKITEDDAATFRDVLSYLQFRGFNVLIEGTTVKIQSRAQLSLRGSNSPAIFLDDAPLPDPYLLFNMRMDEVDEIFINDRGFGGGSLDGAVYGIIRIYTKKTFSSAANIVVKSGSLTVKNGFQPAPEYQNPYVEYQSEAYRKLGAVDWQPRVKTDTEGNFELTVPNLNLDELYLWIEGIGSAGEQISHSVLLPVK